MYTILGLISFLAIHNPMSHVFGLLSYRSTSACMEYRISSANVFKSNHYLIPLICHCTHLSLIQCLANGWMRAHFLLDASLSYAEGR